MKKTSLLIALLFTAYSQAQLVNQSLIVPEFGNGLIRLYSPTSASSIQANNNYTIDLTQLGQGLSTAGSPNCTALLGNDLFVTITAANQRIYRFPNYLIDPTSAIANVSQITNVGNDYVGIAFDSNGNLYASEGDYLNTHIVAYTASSNYSTRIDLGNGGITSYFANITFDSSGNLWSTDYYNNRVIAIAQADLSTQNANFHSLSTNITDWNTNGGHVENLNGTLQAKAITTVFAQPEGLSFDAAGKLWIANNNDSHSNENATLVRISLNLQAQILNSLSTLEAQPNLSSSINGFQVWNIPSSVAGQSQLGGMQIDKAIDRLYVNEQISGTGLWFDLSTLSSIADNFTNYQLGITSTNPGNGGITLAPEITTTGISEAQLNLMCSIYPNPSTGAVSIQSEETIETIHITDSNGKLVSFQLANNQIQLSDVASGIYFVHVQTKSANHTLQLVIQ